MNSRRSSEYKQRKFKIDKADNIIDQLKKAKNTSLQFTDHNLPDDADYSKSANFCLFQSGVLTKEYTLR